MGRLVRAALWLAGVAGAIVVLVIAVREGVGSWRGFQADPLVAGIALAVVATAAGRAIANATGGVGGALEAIAAVAGVASVLSLHLAVVAGFLILTTASIGVAAAASGAAAGSKVFTALALSDVAAVAAMALATEHGSVAPAAPEGPAVWLLAGAATVRVSLAVVPRWVETWTAEGGAPLGALAGAVRAQGFVLSLWVVAAGGPAATAMALVGGVMAAVYGASALRRRSVVAGLAAHGALMLVAIGIGTHAGLVGAVVIGVGTTVAAITVLAGARSLAAPSLGGAALGATFAGLALVASEATGRALVDREFLVVAVPVIASFLWLAQAGAAGFGTGAARGAGVVPAGVALGVGAAMVLLPESIQSRIADGAVRSITDSAPLMAAGSAIQDRLGIALALAAVAGVALLRSTAVPDPPERPAAEPVAPAGTGRSPTGWLFEVGALGAAIALIVASIGRGWL